MQDSSDALRHPANMNQPDRRVHDLAINVGALYASVDQIKLDDVVPAAVVANFETAKNLVLYSFNVYRFLMAASALTYSSIELSLRISQDEYVQRYIKKKGYPPTLRPLLEEAINKKMLKLEDYFSGKSIGDARLAKILDVLNDMRNMHAHGHEHVFHHPFALADLKIAAYIINSLFNTKAKPLTSP